MPAARGFFGVLLIVHPDAEELLRVVDRRLEHDIGERVLRAVGGEDRGLQRWQLGQDGSERVAHAGHIGDVDEPIADDPAESNGRSPMR